MTATIGQTSIFDQLLETASQQWHRDAMTAIEHLAATGEPFQACDVMALAGEPQHPNMSGALMHAARRAGLIEPCGYAPSKRPAVAGSAVREWRGCR